MVVQKDIDRALMKDLDCNELTREVEYKGWDKSNRFTNAKKNLDTLFPITENSNLVYSAESLFYFLRIFYTIYERLLKMRELENGESKLKEFELLWLWKIKKFGQNGLNHVLRNSYSFFPVDSLKKYNYFCNTLPFIF